MGNIWDGGKCAFTLADINNDNQPEMILGNLSGGIAYFSSDTSLISSTHNIMPNKILVYPNPATNKLVVESNDNGIIYIKNLLGKVVYKTIKNSNNLNINTSRFASGIYILQLNKINTKILIQ
jgi:hypothetical protein